MKRGFDSLLYAKAQAKEIKKRVKKFKRLYLEVGGKLCYDEHASRVLPGYKKTAKIEILEKLNNCEIIYCINSKDLQSDKVLGTKKRTYQQQALKDLRDFKKFGMKVRAVVITRFSGERKAKEFGAKMIRSGRQIFFHKEIKNYLKGASYAVKGYSYQPYIPVKKNLILMSGPAGGSGKMAVALSQIYHEEKMGWESGFTKFETFPVWNLPLEHPINLAYEAATADLQDKNMIDPYYKKYHKKNAVNYNRDIENFAILKKIIKKIKEQEFPFGYKSPTEMGVNMIKKGIIDDEICRMSALREIIRRNLFYKKEYRKGREKKATLQRMRAIMRKAGIENAG